jgi:CHAT domain-containing protein
MEYPATIAALSQVGWCLGQQRRFTEEEEVYRQVLALREKLLGPDHDDTAAALEDMRSTLSEQRKLAEAEEFGRRALEILEKTHGLEYPATLSALRGIGWVRGQMRRYAEQEEVYRQVLSLREKVMGARHEDTAASLEDMRWTLAEQGKLFDAEPFARRALAVRIEHFGEEHPDVAQSRHALGGVLCGIGQHDEGERQLKLALSIYRKLFGEDALDLTWPLTELGELYEFQGRYVDARACHERALKIRREKLGPDHPDVALSLSGMAALSSTSLDVAAALDYTRQALDIRRRQFGPEDSTTADSLIHLGILAAFVGRNEEAFDHVSEALRVYRKCGKAQHLFALRAPALLAGICDNLGNNSNKEDAKRAWYERAHRYAEEALEALPEWRRKDITCVGPPLMMLSYLSRKQADFQTAKRYIQEMLDVAQTTAGDKLWVAMGYSRLALDAVLENRDFASAVEPLRELFELMTSRQRSLLSALSDAEGLSLGASGSFGRDLYLSALRHSSANAAEDAYRAVWNSRGLLIGTMAERRRLAQLDPQARDLALQLRALRSELSGLTFAGRDGGFQELGTRLSALNRQKEELQRRLAALVVRGGSAPADAPTTFQRLAERLPRDTAVVEFTETWAVELSETARDGLDLSLVIEAFVLRRVDRAPGYDLKWLKLGLSRPIREAITKWREELTLGRQADANPDGSPDRLVRRLVWEPVEEQLEGCRQVVIIPDGELIRVPWHGLPGRGEGRYLLEDYTISTTHHGEHLFELLSEPDSGDGDVLLVGGVDYDLRTPSPEPTTPEAEVVQRGPAVRAGSRITWSKLPGTLAEVGAIAETWHGNKPPTILEGSSASEPALRSLLPRQRYIHLATHGFFADPGFRSALQISPERENLFGLDVLGLTGGRSTVFARNPMLLSSLVLAGVNQPRPISEAGLPIGDDGFLTAEEVADLDLDKAELVVLSACETGLGEVAGNEGTFGLQRAFHLAGARNVVASLWKVDDQATAALMKLFYWNLWEKQKAPVEALRNAQLTILNNPDLIDTFATTRGPEFERGLELAQRNREGARPTRTPVRHWAAFTFSGTPLIPRGTSPK